MAIVTRNIIRGLRYATLASVTGGSLATLHYNDWDISTFGVVRFGRTFLTVGAIGLDYKYSLRNWKTMPEEESNSLWSQVHERSAKKLLHLCSKNGGVFIKVGQHVGAMEYVVPNEYSSTLKVLHSRAPRSSLDDVRTVLKEDLGEDLDSIFSSFEETPRGTASLAQVHKAVLRETGEVVAVKVQHKRVKKHSLVDMTTMDMLVRIVAKVFPEFSLLWVADEMKRNLPLELDFIHEGKNAEKVSRMFARLPWLKIPRIDWSYTTSRVLTMEFLEGGEVTDREYVTKHKLNPRMISDRLSTLYSEMIFVEGFVHCDPHPGNILVRDLNNSGNPEICLLDHGLYTTLPDKFRINYSNLWISIINADEKGIKQYAQELGAGDLHVILACILAAKPYDTLMRGITAPGKKPAVRAEKDKLRNYVRDFLPEIAGVLSRVNRELILVLKTSDLLRGIESHLGTRGERQSLVQMARYCVRSVYDDRIMKGTSFIGKLKLSIMKQWLLTKLALYQFYLRMHVTFGGPAYR
jgi:aarF domain-containing kinase